MYKKKILLSENYYNLIINENLKEDATAYIQKSNYITIIYENNTKNNHINFILINFAQCLIKLS